jgi:hypothetical protein
LNKQLSFEIWTVQSFTGYACISATISVSNHNYHTTDQGTPMCAAPPGKSPDPRWRASPVPAGLSITPEIIDKELARRQKGYGSGGRMKIEKDTVQILGGVMAGETTGAPIALLVQNDDHIKWKGISTRGSPVRSLG